MFIIIWRLEMEKCWVILMKEWMDDEWMSESLFNQLARYILVT